MNKLLKPIDDFMRSSSSGSIILIFATFLALIIANSPLQDWYTNFMQNDFTIGFTESSFHLKEPFYLWINDGLMAIFFFHVGLEIKREVIAGELSTIKKASLPIIAAIGGVILPILIYIFLNVDTKTAHGWGVPMATDIAFSLGILQLFGKWVPTGLKVFLAAFAIVDDILAVLVIAIFYSMQIHWNLLLYALCILLFLLFLDYKKYFSRFIHFPLSVAVWILFLKSGIHPTIAGVLLALTIPATRRTSLDNFFERIKSSVQTFIQHKEQLQDNDILEEEQVDAAHEINSLSKKISSPLQKIERDLNPWITFIIMPIFAFANAGVNVTNQSNLDFNLVWHIATALILGKTLGISIFSWVSIKTKITNLPSGVTFKHLFGIAILGGLGFTMSLFIANLAFKNHALLSAAKIGILGGSIIAAIVGYVVLHLVLKKNKDIKKAG